MASPIRACFFGDSFVNGVGDATGRGWVGRVASLARAEGIDLTTYNLGVRRDTSADILSRWQSEAAARLPSDAAGRLCFAFGTNDCSDGGAGAPRVAADDALANAKAILLMAMATAPTIMLGPLPALEDPATDERIAAYDGKLASLCRDLRVPYLPCFEAMRSNAEWKEGAARGDGTHPGTAGYERLAWYVWDWMPFRTWLNATRTLGVSPGR